MTKKHLTLNEPGEQQPHPPEIPVVVRLREAIDKAGGLDTYLERTIHFPAELLRTLEQLAAKLPSKDYERVMQFCHRQRTQQ